MIIFVFAQMNAIPCIGEQDKSVFLLDKDQSRNINTAS